MNGRGDIFKNILFAADMYISNAFLFTSSYYHGYENDDDDDYDDDDGNDVEYYYYHHHRPEPQPPSFPTHLYNQIPDDVLGDALCVMLDTRFAVRLQAVEHIYDRYGASQGYEIAEVMQRLMQSDFLDRLGDLRNHGKKHLLSLLHIFYFSSCITMLKLLLIC